jgi:hypothetical protein
MLEIEQTFMTIIHASRKNHETMSIEEPAGEAEFKTFERFEPLERIELC